MSEQLFWNATNDELANGYKLDTDSDSYICLICKAPFENGVIYREGNKLYEAKKAIIHHVAEKHLSMFDYLLDMDKKYTGLSAHQKELLLYFKEGLSDKEIVSKIGGSTSTIRNHRFKLKEKEKQAKVFLAIMNLLKNEKEARSTNEFVDIHKGATMVDERYAITKEEKEKVLSTYFNHGVDGPINTFPSKERRKIILLQEIIKRFDDEKKYSEKEVNEVLKAIFNDFVTLRRYLIEYGFMDRSKDGSEYWVK